MLARILTAAVLIPVVVALVWWGPAALLAAVAAAIALVALHEFFALAEQMGLRSFPKWTMFSTLLLFYAQYSASFVETHTFTGGVSLSRDLSSYGVSVETVLLVLLFGLVALGLATRMPLQQVLPALGVSSAGMLLIALPFSYLVRISEIDMTGRQLLLMTLCLIWAGDMLAYFVGRSVGRLKMAPALSPGKTWEGAAANLVASLLVGLAFSRWMQVDATNLILVAGLANIAGQMGDLIESSYKRGAGAKDSSALLPGHGGMLDRIDSLILASPVVWICYQLLLVRQ
jgi:phosphatidate cytidylyltransferase